MLKTRIVGKSIIALFVATLVVTAMIGLFPASAQAHGVCFSGVRYGKENGHNYVEFRVKMSAKAWHIHQPLWVPLRANLWAYPDGSGVARAGLSPGDYIPPYSASVYKLCVG